jgi:hypothetical protein
MSRENKNPSLRAERESNSNYGLFPHLQGFSTTLFFQCRLLRRHRAFPSISLDGLFCLSFNFRGYYSIFCGLWQGFFDFFCSIGIAEVFKGFPEQSVKFFCGIDKNPLA